MPAYRGVAAGINFMSGSILYSMMCPIDLAPHLSSIRAARLIGRAPDDETAGTVAETGELVDKAAEGT